MKTSQQGAGRLKGFGILLFLAGLGFVAVKTIPVYINNYQLHDFLRQEALRATVNRWPAENIVSRVVSEAQALDLPVERHQVKVQVGFNTVRIALDYTVPIDLKIYTLPLHFTPSAENRGL